MIFGWYDKHVLPCLVDRAMSVKRLLPFRRECLEGVRGRVLELGFGTGRNLPYYSESVLALVAVEPERSSRIRARPRMAQCGFDVSFAEAVDGKLDLSDGMFDFAVSSWTLCTIPAVSEALREVSRVLKPGGRFHFVEHGLAPETDATVRAWQRRLNPLQRAVAGGCHLDRDIPQLISGAGLSILCLSQEYMIGPRPWSCFYTGIAEADAAQRQ